MLVIMFYLDIVVTFGLVFQKLMLTVLKRMCRQNDKVTVLASVASCKFSTNMAVRPVGQYLQVKETELPNSDF